MTNSFIQLMHFDAAFLDDHDANQQLPFNQESLLLYVYPSKHMWSQV